MLRFFVLLALSALTSALSIASQHLPPTKSITFSKMDAGQARSELLQWLAQVAPDQSAARKVTERWTDDDALAHLSGEALLDLLVASFADVDAATQRLAQSTYGSGPIDDIVFDGVRDVAIYRNQVTLFRARWLAQHRYYDEALELLRELSPEEVVDPAGLFFYRAICQAQLLQRRQALDSISLMLNNTLDVPDRFRAVAQIMRQEFAHQDDKGLQLAEQLMSDVERRMDLGRSGEKVQEQEERIVAALDKLLEDMEKQSKQKQQQGGGNSGGSDNQPRGNAADQSTIKGSAADGEADRRNLSEEGAWGMADQQAEAKARELIRQQFPSNYLDAISRYTRRLAEQQK